jgi:hypothetical protein
LSKNKNELTLLNPYPSNNKKTVYISKPLYSWNFTRISLNRKVIQRVVLIPLMQTFLLRHLYIYPFLRQKRGIMKVTIYKGFTYVHCLFVASQIINDPPPPKKIIKKNKEKKPS